MLSPEPDSTSVSARSLPVVYSRFALIALKASLERSDRYDRGEDGGVEGSDSKVLGLLVLGVDVLEDPVDIA